MSASNNKKCPYVNIDKKISIIFDGKKYDAFKCCLLYTSDAADD